MKITTQLNYPKPDQSQEIYIDRICDLMPRFGGEFEKRITSIVFWRDDEPGSVIKRLTEQISYDGKIEFAHKPNELICNCHRQYPAWYIYVPMIPFVLVFPILWLFILPEFNISGYWMIPLVVLFLILPLVNYYYLAPYFFKNTMRKILDEALT